MVVAGTAVSNLCKTWTILQRNLLGVAVWMLGSLVSAVTKE